MQHISQVQQVPNAQKSEGEREEDHASLWKWGRTGTHAEICESWVMPQQNVHKLGKQSPPFTFLLLSKKGDF